jgi:hypothetical protein
MWANTVWGLAGLSFSCFLARLAISDPYWRWWLLVGAIVFAVTSLAVLVSPLIIRVKTRTKGRSGVSLTFESNLADLPHRCPRQGQIASMRLFHRPGSAVTEPIGFITKHCVPGARVDWFRDLKFPQVYRCEITNYGDAPLLQVSVNFGIEYREATQDENNPSVTKAGDVVHLGNWPVLFPKIDPGKENASTFYVYNESRYFASVTPPDSASYIPLGHNSPKRAALLPIGMIAGMSLWPVERTGDLQK